MFLLDLNILISCTRIANFQENQLPQSTYKEWQERVQAGCDNVRLTGGISYYWTLEAELGLRQCNALLYPDGYGVAGWGTQVRQAGPTRRHPPHLLNGGSKPLLVGWQRRWGIFSNLPSRPLGFEFTLFFPAVKIQRIETFYFHYTNFHPRITIIAVDLFASLCCGLRPNLYLGRTPTTTNLPLPKTHKYMSTKTLFSTGWQNPSQNCSGLAKPDIPLQSHAPSQRDLFIHGQCLSKDVQNYFLALLEESLSQVKELHVIPKHRVLLFLFTPEMLIHFLSSHWNLRSSEQRLSLCPSTTPGMQSPVSCSGLLFTLLQCNHQSFSPPNY